MQRSIVVYYSQLALFFMRCKPANCVKSKEVITKQAHWREPLALIYQRLCVLLKSIFRQVFVSEGFLAFGNIRR